MNSILKVCDLSPCGDLAQLVIWRLVSMLLFSSDELSLVVLYAHLVDDFFRRLWQQSEPSLIDKRKMLMLI